MHKVACLIHAFSEKEPFGLELVDAYRQSAIEAGYTIHFINIYSLHFDPFAYTGRIGEEVEPDLKQVIHHIQSARQLVICVPVYRAYIPSLSQAFFNKIFQTDPYGRPPAHLWGNYPDLQLKTARIISLLDHYSWQEFKVERTARYHPLKKSVLEVLGFNKVYTTTIPPQYKNGSPDYHEKWIKKIRGLGEKIF
jgi:putative NADPH-quinone reductase